VASILIFTRSLQRATFPISRHVFLPPGSEGEPDLGIVLDVLVLVALRFGQEAGRVLVAVDMRRKRPRANILPAMHAEHPKADLLDQLPEVVGVAVVGHGFPERVMRGLSGTNTAPADWFLTVCRTMPP
jgi:hypothetical protein